MALHRHASNQPMSFALAFLLLFTLGVIGVDGLSLLLAHGNLVELIWTATPPIFELPLLAQLAPLELIPPGFRWA